MISPCAISRMRFFIRALRVCQPPPPSRSSCDLGVLRAVARQQLDIFDRQEELVAAGVMQLQAIVRRAGRLDLSSGRRSGRCRDRHARRDRPPTSADSSVRKFSAALAALARAHEAVAENVLLADDGEIAGDETLLEPDHGQRDARVCSAIACASEETGSTFAGHVRPAQWPRRSREPSDQPATITRLPSPCSARICPTAASNTLAFSSARSGAKLRPARRRNR